jgi:hypothetical protein
MDFDTILSFDFKWQDTYWNSDLCGFSTLNTKFDRLLLEHRNLVVTRRLIFNRQVAIIQVIRSWH